MKARIVLDKDDTLIHTGPLYDRSVLGFLFMLYASAIGRYLPCFDDVLRIFRTKDREGFGLFGVRRGGLAWAMLQTLAEVQKWIKEHYRFDPAERYASVWDDISKKADFCGDGPFLCAEEAPWIEGAEDALDRLGSDGHALYLFSAYDEFLFPVQYRALRLGRFFGEQMEWAKAVGFREEPRKLKEPEDFAALAGWTPENDQDFVWVAVGNSMSDIKPALKLSPRWHGFRVPFATSSIYVGVAGGAKRRADDDKLSPAPPEGPTGCTRGGCPRAARTS